MRNKEPILASREYRDRVPMIQFVYGGLEYIKGNNKPYFTLTCWNHRKGFPNQCQSGGCDHESILKHWPRFADLAALHLSDIDGVPMHAEANGWYDLAGFLGGTEYRRPTREECLAIFAKHCRVDIEQARHIAAVVAAAPDPRKRWAEYVEEMKPRWKAEAEACIKRHNLRIFGDPWEPDEAAA